VRNGSSGGVRVAAALSSGSMACRLPA